MIVVWPATASFLLKRAGRIVSLSDLHRLMRVSRSKRLREVARRFDLETPAEVAVERSAALFIIYRLKTSRT